ncbi:hypothetical protein C8F04DRAFT_1316025 [Mycena alexandri]|uniref:Uncharacterized protein n=1 Tax=Mycena alexandri TaxID=1745969 RepID=A0AAD6T5S1_9AGAR|nr:hypothetical protein C8F04DRAFT_1316025 [Mycena alexandri]
MLLPSRVWAWVEKLLSQVPQYLAVRDRSTAGVKCANRLSIQDPGFKAIFGRQVQELGATLRKIQRSRRVKSLEIQDLSGKLLKATGPRVQDLSGKLLNSQYTSRPQWVTPQNSRPQVASRVSNRFKTTGRQVQHLSGTLLKTEGASKIQWDTAQDDRPASSTPQWETAQDSRGRVRALSPSSCFLVVGPGLSTRASSSSYHLRAEAKCRSGDFSNQAQDRGLKTRQDFSGKLPRAIVTFNTLAGTVKLLRHLNFSTSKTASPFKIQDPTQKLNLRGYCSRLKTSTLQDSAKLLKTLKPQVASGLETRFKTIGHQVQELSGDYSRVKTASRFNIQEPVQNLSGNCSRFKTASRLKFQQPVQDDWPSNSTPQWETAQDSSFTHQLRAEAKCTVFNPRFDLVFTAHLAHLFFKVGIISPYTLPSPEVCTVLKYPVVSEDESEIEASSPRPIMPSPQTENPFVQKLVKPRIYRKTAHIPQNQKLEKIYFDDMSKYISNLDQLYLEGQGTTSERSRSPSDVLSGASAPTAVSCRSWFNRRITAPVFGRAWRDLSGRPEHPDRHVSLLSTTIRRRSMYNESVPPGSRAGANSLRSAFCIAHLIAAMGDYILAHIAPPSSAPRGTPLHRSPAPSRPCKATTHAAEGPQIRAKPGSTLTITGGSAHPRRACPRCAHVPTLPWASARVDAHPPTHTSRPPVMRAAVLIHCRSAPTHTTAHTKPSLSLGASSVDRPHAIPDFINLACRANANRRR